MRRLERKIREIELRKELRAMGVPVYASKSGGRFIKMTDAKRVLAFNALSGYDKSVMPIKIKSAGKARRVLDDLGIEISSGFIATADVEKVMKVVRAEVVGDQIIWYDKKTGEVIAAFDIWQKLKGAAKTLLEKGTAVLIGIAVLAGSASGKDLKKAEDLKTKYAKAIEMVGSDLGLDLDVDLDTSKYGGVSKTKLTITNTDSGNSIIYDIMIDAGSFSDIQMKTVTQEKGGELDYSFEGLGTEIYESLRDQVQDKGLGL
jgi:hypothetical protein